MKQRVIALGLFDGVHLGHAALLRRAAIRAKELDATSAALTFATPPAQVLGKGAAHQHAERAHCADEAALSN